MKSYSRWLLDKLMGSNDEVDLLFVRDNGKMYLYRNGYEQQLFTGAEHRKEYEDNCQKVQYSLIPEKLLTRIKLLREQAERNRENEQQ